MRSLLRCIVAAFAILFAATFTLQLNAQGSAGTVRGTVTDPAGAFIGGADVAILNSVSGYSRQTKSDSSGHYEFTNLPLNPYRVTVSAQGFNTSVQNVSVDSVIPVAVATTLRVGIASENVTVTAEDLIESDPTDHTDVDRDLFDKVPLESQSSTLSSLVTLASPGIAADSNGLFHGLGDHASNSFSIDCPPTRCSRWRSSTERLRQSMAEKPAWLST
jgi:hypothetical protein